MKVFILSAYPDCQILSVFSTKKLAVAYIISINPNLKPVPDCPGVWYSASQDLDKNNDDCWEYSIDEWSVVRRKKKL